MGVSVVVGTAFVVVGTAVVVVGTTVVLATIFTGTPVSAVV